LETKHILLLYETYFVSYLYIYALLGRHLACIRIDTSTNTGISVCVL